MIHNRTGIIKFNSGKLANTTSFFPSGKGTFVAANESYYHVAPTACCVFPMRSGSPYDNMAEVIGSEVNTVGIVFYQSDGKHGFSAVETTYSQYYSTGSGNIFTLDINGDNQDDIGYAANYNFVSYIYQGNGNFNEVISNFSLGNSGVSIVVDLNSDGKDDIVSFNGVSTSTYQSFISVGDGNFISSTLTYISSKGYSPLKSDINGDKLIDIVLTNAPNTKTLLISNLFSEGNGYFHVYDSTPYNTLTQTTNPFSADINGDGRDEIILPIDNNGLMSFVCYFYKDNSTYSQVQSDKLCGASFNQNDKIFPMDLDLDGMDDIMHIRNNDGEVALNGYISDGLCGFTLVDGIDNCPYLGVITTFPINF